MPWDFSYSNRNEYQRQIKKKFLGVETGRCVRLITSTPCYRDTFKCLHADDVRTSQETHIWIFAAYYSGLFTFYT
jgi:wyosine [tRNA(Phe)-imidazoG37] synthetase (radical SAM superfamily)